MCPAVKTHAAARRKIDDQQPKILFSFEMLQQQGIGIRARLDKKRVRRAPQIASSIDESGNLSSTLAVSCAGFAAAQSAAGSTNAAPSTTTQSQNGKNSLSLTADQKTQIKQIRQNEKQQIQAVKTDNSLSKDQKKALSDLIA